MTADEARRGPDRSFRQVGIGMPRTFGCMGCGKPRQPLGSRGVGIRKRCSHCLESARTLSASRQSAPGAGEGRCGWALSAGANT